MLIVVLIKIETKIEYNKQDLRKSTFKTLYVGANGIRFHAHVVPVRKS